MAVVHLISNTKGSIYDLVSLLCNEKESENVFYCVRKTSFFTIIEVIRNAKILHLHEPILILFIPILKIIFKKIIIVTLHDEGVNYLKLTMPFFKSNMLTPFFKFSLKFPDYIICVSNKVKSLYNFNKIPVSVIYNPIILNNIPKSTYIKPTNNLIFVGNQFVAKGFHKLLENINYFDEYNLHFFGIREDQKKKFGERKNINTYSFSDKKTLFTIINKLEGIIVITSLSEGFGMFVAECANLGFPMVLNFLDVYREFLDFNESNIFDISNVETLIKSLKTGDFESGVKIKSDFDGAISSYLNNTYLIYNKINNG